MRLRRKIDDDSESTRSIELLGGSAMRSALALMLALSTPALTQAQLGLERLSPSSTVSILTILPGDEIYSMFGHTAIRVQDPEQAVDHTYNYGTFAFGNPLVFTARFAYGNLDYILSETSFPRMFAFYRDVAKRPIIEQTLNLSHAQRQKLFEFLERNARPENRAYRYDFLFDNCSTRVRDALYEQLDSLQYATNTVPEATFRHLLDPYAADRPFLDFGWDLLLGSPVDRQAESWETMFLPLYLMAAIDSATINVGTVQEPFVASKDTLFWIEGRDLPQASAPWPSIVMWAIFWAGLSITIMQRTGGWLVLGRWFDALLFGIVGIAGLLMLLMWVVSLHSVTNYNWNLLWAWPTHLIAGVVLAKRGAATWMRAYLVGAVLFTTSALLGWILLPQELPVAAIPIVLLLGLRSAWRAFGKDAHREQTVRAAAS